MRRVFTRERLSRLHRPEVCCPQGVPEFRRRTSPAGRRHRRPRGRDQRAGGRAASLLQEEVQSSSEDAAHRGPSVSVETARLLFVLFLEVFHGLLESRDLFDQLGDLLVLLLELYFKTQSLGLCSGPEEFVSDTERICLRFGGRDGECCEAFVESSRGVVHLVSILFHQVVEGLREDLLEVPVPLLLPQGGVPGGVKEEALISCESRASLSEQVDFLLELFLLSSGKGKSALCVLALLHGRLLQLNFLLKCGLHGLHVIKLRVLLLCDGFLPF
mmetsp:Transcript_12030/g.23176  ORF Transcript_12030/g.23176 Transcript_12030/m.23176 type:complete len:273 (+) Transcript_12030:236-1054(+)